MMYRLHVLFAYSVSDAPRMSSTNYWLIFLRGDTFISKLQDSHKRSLLQPALVLSALAMACLMKSSQVERGREGRDRALALRDEAQSMLETACNTRQIDYQLAEAALVSPVFM